MDTFLNRFLPHFFLTVLVVIIALINHHPHTMLFGWDNLLPELNFGLNLKRSLFAVWQEYQGLGLLGGMGHASDLLRQLILFFLSFVIPTTLLRYLWTMSMLLLGTLGAYEFILYLLRIIFPHSPLPLGEGLRVRGKPPQKQQIFDIWQTQVPDDTRQKKLDDFKLLPPTSVQQPFVQFQMPAFCGALFYLLNLATIQTFYVPFEAFTAHFGFLPWLLYSAITYISARNDDKKPLLFVSLILLLATPGAYVPTLFIVYLMAISILLGTLLITQYLSFRAEQSEAEESHITDLQGQSGEKDPSTRSSVGMTIKKILTLYLFIFLINAFWLLPFLYFTLTNASVLINAKMNQMATDKVYAQNLEFGNIFDVMLLRGFWFTNTNPDIQGTFVYMMGIWKTYSYNFFIALFGCLQFLTISIGFFAVLKTKKPLAFALCTLFVFAVTTLITNQQPFAFIDTLFRTYFPLFHEAFRYTFTKFSLLAALMYSVFFAVGIQTVTDTTNNATLPILFTIQQKLRKTVFTIRHMPFAISHVAAIISCVIVTFPIFLGHLFYPKEQRLLPPEYNQLINFFQQQDPSTRIADFPQNEIWGWSFTKWGYEGSGFLWYAIPQPIMDRAFDVWSAHDENYYWEMISALDPPNPPKLEAILNKYQITWLVVDKSIIFPDKPSLDYSKMEETLFSRVPRINLVKTFGALDIYKVNLRHTPKDFVFLTRSLPSVNAYQWSDTDIAYQTYGNYQTDKQNALTYPFRSLFTGKDQSDRAFSVQKKANSIAIKHAIALDPKQTTFFLRLPTLQETVLPVTLQTAFVSGGTLDLHVLYLTPKILFNDQPVWQESSTQTIFRFLAGAQFPFLLTINGSQRYIVSYQTQTLGTFLLHRTQDTIVDIARGTQHTAISLRPTISALPPIFHHDEILSLNEQHQPLSVSVEIPTLAADVIDPTKISGNFKNCNLFRFGSFTSSLQNTLFTMTGENATPCVAYYASNLDYDNGYLLTFSNLHTTGQALHFWLDNPMLQNSPLDTLLPANTDTMFVINPLGEQGQGYGIHVDEDSYGSNITTNSIGTITAYPIPYQFLTNMTLTHTLTIPRSYSLNPNSFRVTHPNESLYGVTIKQLTNDQQPTTLVLSQGYDAGWKLYRVPSINWFWYTFPFFAGSALDDSHVLINNWENGWNLDAQTLQGGQHYIIIYLPQYLEYIGFLLLMGTSIWIAWWYIPKSSKQEPNV